ncbi:MAG: galactokinase family protein [Phycisphaerae bacterium]
MVQETAGNLLLQAAVVILCGGKGTRMGSDNRHKVCFPIEGIPAINRTVKLFAERGLRRVVIVVGALAGDVVATVGQDFPHVMFVYQSQQLGTGHATQIGVNALRAIGFNGPILVTMGDKLIEPQVLDHISEKFLRQRADMVFVTGPKKQNPGAGRIVTDKTGRILGNIEERDIQLARIFGAVNKLIKSGKGSKITFAQIITLGQKYISNESKLVKSLGPFAARLKQAGELTSQQAAKLLGQEAGFVKLAKRLFTGDEVEKASRTANLSVYLASSDFWYQILPTLQNNNAQNEYYLSDVVTLGGAGSESGWKIQQYEISDPSKVMAFNSPDELLMIEDTLRRKSLLQAQVQHKPVAKENNLSQAIGNLPSGSFRKAGKWLEIFESWPSKLAQRFSQIYGPDKALLEDRRKLFITALKLFVKRYGADRPAIIVRAPGRINLLGRHVDHRGGAVNVMAIDRDVVFVASPRNDDSVRMCNVRGGTHPDREFNIGQLLGEIEWQDWVSFVNSEYVRRIIAQTRGDWSNYVKAALLRLQQGFRQVRILGFDAAVAGDIPQAAGLSSSSALVVASAEVAMLFNGLNVSSSELVDLCGEGEWFVGSRGGSADHAAIRMGRRGQIAHVKFFPFEIAKIYNFPESCRLVIANSGIDAHKSSTAKDKFNQRVASYEFGFMLLKDRNEQYNHLLEHLRDVNPRRLNCTISQIYRLLQSIPEKLPTSTLRDLLSGQYRQKVERIMSSHNLPDYYDLRSVLLYGIAECERSIQAPDLLAENHIESFGKLMMISHDGDRLVRCRRTAKNKWLVSKYSYDVSDAAIERFCQDLVSEEPSRVLRSQLYMQPGGYGCSTRQIDKMIDIVKNVPGFYGAQLGGAGLGGCIMILVQSQASETVAQALKREYYQPANIEPMIHICQPVEGSGIVAI